MSAEMNEFTFEWAIAFQAAVAGEVRTRFGEVAHRWPLVAGSWRFDAFDVTASDIGLVLYPVRERVAVAGPGIPVKLPAGFELTLVGAADDLQKSLLEGLSAPSDSVAVVVDRSLPLPRNMTDGAWNLLRTVWERQISNAFIRLLLHVVENPPEKVTDSPEAAPAAGPHYDPHPSFREPGDPDTPLWRYLNTPKLIDLMRRSELWFSRLDQLGDPHEGALGEANMAFRQSGEASSSLLPPMSPFAREQFFVSCWHESQHESAAMWAIYAASGEGVCVKSSFRRLVEATAGPHRFHAGLVSYVERGAFIPEDNLFERVMHKRSSFEHEHEVRAVILQPVDVSPLGLHVTVDICQLIESIHVAPGQPDWFLEVVRDVCSRYQPDLVVVRSDMDRDPIW